MLAYLEFRTRCAWLMLRKERGQLQRLFFLAVLKQDGGAKSGPSSNAILRGAGQLSWRLTATTHPALIASLRGT